MAGLLRSDHWDRLAGSYHGSGCTLARAVAAGLAHGLVVGDAAREAQEYTWQTLAAGFRPGMGQFIPDRFFWARRREEGHVRAESQVPWPLCDYARRTGARCVV